MALEEVTEAVLDRDLRDLREAANIPRGRLGLGHAVSLTRVRFEASRPAARAAARPPTPLLQGATTARSRRGRAHQPPRSRPGSGAGRPARAAPLRPARSSAGTPATTPTRLSCR